MALAAAAAAVLPAPARAVEPLPTAWLNPGPWTAGQDWGWLSGDVKAANLTGGWGGARDALAAHGLQFGIAYTGQLAANPVGGRVPGHASYVGDWDLTAYADLQTMFGLAHPLYATASFDLLTWNVGLSEAYVGNVFDVQLNSQPEPGPQTRLVHLALGTLLFDGKVEAVAGRLVASDEFATIDMACTSLNGSICSVPAAIAENVSFPGYPTAAWAGRVKLQPSRDWYVQAGAYLVQQSLGDADNHGAEFGAPPGAGILAMAEAAVSTGTAGTGTGPPGTFKVGGYYDSEELPDLATGIGKRGTWGVYAMGERMVWSADEKHDRGLWAWGALSYAPADVNRLEFMAAGGLSYAGPFAGRPDDAVSVMVAAGWFSDELPGQDVETVLEVNYKAQLGPALYVQPGIQYVIDPDGRSDIEDALVIGFAVGATF